MTINNEKEVVKLDKLTLSVSEAAKKLGVSKSFLYSIIEKGDSGIPVVKIGKRILIPQKGLIEFIDSQVA